MKNLAALLRKARDILCSMLDVMLFPIQKFLVGQYSAMFLMPCTNCGNAPQR